MNASILVGYIPARFYRRYGPKKTILIGGTMLTIAHIISLLILTLEIKSGVATILMFVAGIMGGQGACIVFLSALGATLKMHSIISTSLVS